MKTFDVRKNFSEPPTRQNSLEADLTKIPGRDLLVYIFIKSPVTSGQLFLSMIEFSPTENWKIKPNNTYMLFLMYCLTISK